MNSGTNFLSQITSIITAGGVVFVAFQAYYARKQIDEQQKQLKEQQEQIKANHDLERRKTALDVLHRHALNVDKNTSRYLNFAFGLSDKNIQNLMNLKSFILEDEDKYKFFPNTKMNEDNKLPFDIILDIRFVIIKLMNILEEIALSYIHKVADKKIIESAMKDYLITSNNNILDGCIQINKTYPNGSSPILEQFQTKLRNKLKARKITA